MTEEWRDIPGWEGIYQVSSLGRIKSLPRKRVVYVECPEQIIKPRIGSRGYPQATLKNASKRQTVDIHSAVAKAFLGPRKDGMQVAHQDGDRANAQLSNLRYATPAENCADKQRHGTQPKGEGVWHRARLTHSAVLEIKTLLRQGDSRAQVARRFGVAYTTIANIASGQTWKHVT